MKLHLGCGQRYFEGYINIDYPESSHTVMKDIKADVYADITTLKYSPMTADEIRLHHVFEHFTRPVACGLLASWHSWLKTDGVIRIEVPDFYNTGKVVLNPKSNERDKFVALRHIFGSQEAHWAFHCEGYTSESLSMFIELFGFEVSEVLRNDWLGTYNIEIIAKKGSQPLDANHFNSVAHKYLSKFMVGDVESERELLKTWMGVFHEQMNKSFSDYKQYSVV